jgi:hypothetical protein
MGRPLVESCLSIDVTDLRRLLEVRGAGALRWHGVDLAVSYRLEPGGSVLLSYPGGQQQRLRLVSFPIHNGGARYYFDVGARRCKKVFLPHGGDTFRRRQSYGLRYRSQALGKMPRERLRVHRILSLIGPAGEAVRRRGIRKRRWRNLVSRLHVLMW